MVRLGQRGGGGGGRGRGCSPQRGDILWPATRARGDSGRRVCPPARPPRAPSPRGSRLDGVSPPAPAEPGPGQRCGRGTSAPRGGGQPGARARARGIRLLLRRRHPARYRIADLSRVSRQNRLLKRGARRAAGFPALPPPRPRDCAGTGQGQGSGRPAPPRRALIEHRREQRACPRPPRASARPPGGGGSCRPCQRKV